MKNTLKSKLKKIKLLALDVDGILTDGSINIDSNGEEFKIFDVQDGFGIVFFRRAGFKVAIISARSANAVTARAKDLGIDRVYQDQKNKVSAYEELKKEFAISDEEVCFMGDDLPDLGVLNRVGLPVTVPNAVEEVKSVCIYVTKKNGGRGAIREVVEMILKSQEKWEGIVKAMSSIK